MASRASKRTSSSGKGGEDDSDDAVSLGPDEMMILDEEDYAYLHIVGRGQAEETENKNTKKDNKDEVKSQRKVAAPGKDIPKNVTSTTSVESDETGKKQEPLGSGNSTGNVGRKRIHLSLKRNNDQALKLKLASDYNPITHEDISVETERDVKENSGKIMDVKPVREEMKKGENVNRKENSGDKKSDTSNSKSSGDEGTSKPATQSSSISRGSVNLKDNSSDKKSDTNNSKSSGGGGTSKTTNQSSSIQKSTQNQGTASGSSKVSLISFFFSVIEMYTVYN